MILHVLHTVTCLSLAFLSVVRCEGSNYRVNSRGILFYYNGEKGFDLKSAEELCQRMDGRLPTVHKLEDILFLKKMTGMAIWLAGRQVSNGTYEWDDKTEFNMAPWFPGEPECHPEACCGIYLTRNHNRFATKTCDDDSMFVVCQLNPIRRTTTDIAHHMTLRHLEQSIISLNESMAIMLLQQFGKAISYSEEIQKNLTQMMDKVVQDFRGTIESIERQILKNQTGKKRRMQINTVD